MTETLLPSHVWCSGRLEGWRPILNQWIGLVSKYAGGNWGTEYVRVPYWYTERANVGLLAGAAIREDWLALEEFTHDKVGREGQGKKGRLDLWLRRGESMWAVEAKQCWPAPGGSVRNGMKDAVRAAEETLHGYDGAQPVHKVAVCFAVPQFPVNAKEPLNQRVDRFLLRVTRDFPEGSVEADAVAWTFPEHFRGLIDKDREYFYPGVVLIAKTV